jgi:tetratricopeptide (TPR) repeat protein
MSLNVIQPLQGELEYANKVIDEVFKESDRAAGVLVGAEIDAQLERLLIHTLLPPIKKKKNDQDTLFKYPGPISTFSARIELAYRLGLISDVFRHDLNIIRDIRNKFAHGLIGTTFSTSPIKEWGSNLVIGRGMVNDMFKNRPLPTNGKLPYEAKNVFRLTATFLLAQLIITRYKTPKIATSWDKPGSFTISAEEQISACLKALEINPNNVGTRNQLSLVLSQTGQLDEAISGYRKALEIDPKSLPAQCNLGSALAQKQQFDEAETHLRAALEINPNVFEAHANLANVLFHKGLKDEGIAHYRRALEINSKNVDVINAFGGHLLQAGQVDEAIIQMQKALEIAPENANVQSNSGMAFFEKKCFADAAKHFQKALEIDSTNLPVRAKLGEALFYVRKLDEAITQYQAVLAADLLC